jgi:hypothetical protein
MGKKSGSGSGISNPDYISESLKTIFWVKILKFSYADPGWKNSDPRSGMEKILIRDPVCKKIWIRDKHPGSATQIFTFQHEL